MRRPINLRLTEQTYPLEPSIEQSWLPIAFRAFERLARRRARRARADHRHRQRTGRAWRGRDSRPAQPHRHRSARGQPRGLTRQRPCAPRESRIDRAELPHRRSHVVRARRGRRFRSCTRTCRTSRPRRITICAVARSAGGSTRRRSPSSRSRTPDTCLTCTIASSSRRGQGSPQAGGVLTAIGGRMPDDVVFDLHRSCGLRPELVAFDVKLQAEPRLMVPPYARAESERGVAFRFYAAEAVGSWPSSEPQVSTVSRSLDAAAPDLDRLSMSAAEAAGLVERGLPVAHSVLMVFGERRRMSRPARIPPAYRRYETVAVGSVDILAACPPEERRTEARPSRRSALSTSRPLDARCWPPPRASFGRKGYAQSSVDDIAAAARVTKGAVYHHFAGKKALFRAVYSEVEAEAQARTAAAVEPRGRADRPDRGRSARVSRRRDGRRGPADHSDRRADRAGTGAGGSRRAASGPSGHAVVHRLGDRSATRSSISTPTFSLTWSEASLSWGVC